MRTAVISDIHGNSAALEKVLTDAKSRKCDEIICLGDVIGYGYDPVGCIKLVRKNCSVCVMGNHDAGVVAAMSLEWFAPAARDGVLRDRTKIGASYKEWIRGLEYQHVTNPTNDYYAAFSHGTFTYPYEFEYIDNTIVARMEMDAMKQAHVGLLFVGHTHEATCYVEGGRYADEANYLVTTGRPIDKTKQTIVNVGSVGYPRQQPYTSYAVLDVDPKTGDLVVEQVKLPFDFEEYIKNLESANIPIPHWMVRWEGDYF